MNVGSITNMLCHPLTVTVLISLLGFGPLATILADDGVPKATPATIVNQATIVTLGDSITKGFRPGVSKQQTFSALLESRLHEFGMNVRVINRGIGGERTDQCLQRLDQITQMQPDLVTVMYGTNDSYTDPGKTSSRISVIAYRHNLTKILGELIEHDIQPILMTPPRFASGATDGQGRDSNINLQVFVAACREVAKAMNVPLIDHFADWSAAEKKGLDLNRWTTDRCHPNPAGHRVMAETIIPIVRFAISTKVETP